MIFLLDTCIWRKLLDHFPKKGSRFETIWAKLDQDISDNRIKSVDECLSELLKHYDPKQENAKWLQTRKQIFEYPSDEESLIIKSIFASAKMRENVALKNILENRPCADVYIVAKAKATGATVVTAENYKPQSAKLPNMCEKFGVICIGYDDFMFENFSF